MSFVRISFPYRFKVYIITSLNRLWMWILLIPVNCFSRRLLIIFDCFNVKLWIEREETIPLPNYQNWPISPTITLPPSGRAQIWRQPLNTADHSTARSMAIITKDQSCRHRWACSRTTSCWRCRWGRWKAKTDNSLTTSKPWGTRKMCTRLSTIRRWVLKKTQFLNFRKRRTIRWD